MVKNGYNIQSDRMLISHSLAFSDFETAGMVDRNGRNGYLYLMVFEGKWRSVGLHDYISLISKMGVDICMVSATSEMWCRASDMAWWTGVSISPHG